MGMTVRKRCSKLRDLCVLLSRGGFRLTKWLCDRRQVLKTIPTSDRASSILDLDLNSGVLPIEITLGVQCNMDSDMFTFKTVPRGMSFTRRGILSVTSYIYYPLDIVSPVTSLAKKSLKTTTHLGWRYSGREISVLETMAIKFTYAFKCCLTNMFESDRLWPSTKCRASPLCRCLSDCLWNCVIKKTRQWK